MAAKKRKTQAKKAASAEAADAPRRTSGLARVHEANVTLFEENTRLTAALADAKLETAELRTVVRYDEQRVAELRADSDEWKRKAEALQTRVEQLKALTWVDRLLGRHKGV
ncbi:MAG: hypothetical protein FDZ70_10620 [Actinobacteria bacterium]|nr:MAG: hypothetical protein FDZ70_10620 [Actinomycetota bacterium]